MKKNLKFVAVLMSVSILLSSCMGSFQLTNKMYNINKNVGSKWVNELVFAACCVLPVYEITLFVDAVVLNSIEFWTGKKALSNNGEKKIVKNAEGKTVEVTAMENGYNLTDGAVSMNLVFDEDTQVWSAEFNNQSTKLIKMIDDSNAELFLLNGETLSVTLDEAGVDMARQLIMGNCYAMSK
ncbi:MAG: DUF3332 domain-containing protein [Bacteroidaceae bacterium]|nr:DUF3332 domain-containing protein [Bacteroidaceae bacterium]